jgi:UDP-N-acetylglucosamine 2-epimerase (non-hydrolysing)
MKVICVVGARPNFMKAAPVIAALTASNTGDVQLVHTGQHYDRRMSELFFEELGLPRPHVDLHVGSGTHGEQTGQVMVRFDPVLRRERPDLVMVFGDVNSTVAAALCAAKMGVPVAHVEAGLRSFDRTMPEELNRIVADHLSDYLFTTEPSARMNLLREGIAEERIHFVGNVMVDTLMKHRVHADRLRASETFGLRPRAFGVLTLHRPSNVDDTRTLTAILQAVAEVASELPIVFPCHVRTQQRLEEHDGLRALMARSGIWLTDPLGYLEFLSLMAESRLVLTDSGGIQEETTVLGVPCLTLRENTERPVTLTQGTNILVGTSPERIVSASRCIISGEPRQHRIPDLWDGRAAERIVAILQKTSHVKREPLMAGGVVPINE